MSGLLSAGRIKHLLIISTERVVKYLLGGYAGRHFRAESMGGIDYGSYYAARTMTNTGDRRILWGWLTEGRSAEAQRAAGWSGVMSLPRELKLLGSQVQMRPAAEVETLRGKRLGGGAEGDWLEIQAEIDPGDAARAGLNLRAAPDGSEQTLVYYDRDQRLLCVDRSQSSTDRKRRPRDAIGTVPTGPRRAVAAAHFSGWVGDRNLRQRPVLSDRPRLPGGPAQHGRGVVFERRGGQDGVVRGLGDARGAWVVCRCRQGADYFVSDPWQLLTASPRASWSDDELCHI